MLEFGWDFFKQLHLSMDKRQYNLTTETKDFLNVNAIGLYTVNVSSLLAAVEYERSKSPLHIAHLQK
jgi:hypothetical protein